MNMGGMGEALAGGFGKLGKRGSESPVTGGSDTVQRSIVHGFRRDPA
jgi:hypothetical protein